MGSQRVGHDFMTFTSLHIYTIHIYSVAFPKLENKLQESWNLWDFPGSPVTNTSLSNVGGLGLTLSQGAEIPLASLPKTKNVKQKKCCIIQQRLLKKGPHQKNLKKRERERVGIGRSVPAFGIFPDIQ